MASPLSPAGAPLPSHHSADSASARCTPAPRPIRRATALATSQAAMSKRRPNSAPSRTMRSTSRSRARAGRPRVASGTSVAVQSSGSARFVFATAPSKVSSLPKRAAVSCENAGQPTWKRRLA